MFTWFEADPVSFKATTVFIETLYRRPYHSGIFWFQTSPFTDVTINDRRRKQLCWLRWIHLDSAFGRKKTTLVCWCSLEEMWSSHSKGSNPRLILEAPSSSSFFSPSTRSSCFSPDPGTELTNRLSPQSLLLHRQHARPSHQADVPHSSGKTITGLFHVILFGYTLHNRVHIDSREQRKK